MSLQRAVISLNDASEGRLIEAFSESCGRRLVVSFVWRSSVEGEDGGSSDSDIWTSCDFVVVAAISSVVGLSVAIVKKGSLGVLEET